MMNNRIAHAAAPAHTPGSRPAGTGSRPAGTGSRLSDRCRLKLKRVSAPLFALLFCIFLPISGAHALKVPAWSGPVADLGDVIGAQTEAELVQYLSAVNEQTGVQVAVLTVPSLGGVSIEEYSIEVAEEWGLGQAGKDNGALLVVSVEDRQLRIEVGYGLEGELTDAKSGLIIRNVIVPYFRDGDYANGIVEGTRNIVGVATGNAEIVSSSVRHSAGNGSQDSGGSAAGFVFFVLFIIVMFGGLGRRRGRSGGWFWPLVIGSMLSNSGRGHSSWSGRSGGKSGFSGGGGFGGFSGGGGHFGGGGASGGW